MQTIECSCVSITEVNRSKFIVHLMPISEFDGLQKRLRTEYPKANHVVWKLMGSEEKIEKFKKS